MQFLYKLKLIPKLLDKENWTERENQIIDAHFNALQQLLTEDKLIMAGRTMNMDATTFGIVILQVESEDEATALMNNDPAVKEKIMTAELYPYKVALYNQNFKG